MRVRCFLVNVEGVPSVVYCPGRTDIEMNKKIRSLFQYYPRLQMTRVGIHCTVWHGGSLLGQRNKFAMGLLGKAVCGPLFIVTRADGEESGSLYVDTQWSHITEVVEERQRSFHREGAVQPKEQLHLPPKQEQRKSGIHIGAPALNITRNNTSMGSSVSVQEKDGETSAVQRVTINPLEHSVTIAYSGEGAFTYKPQSVPPSGLVAGDEVTPLSTGAKGEVLQADCVHIVDKDDVLAVAFGEKVAGEIDLSEDVEANSFDKEEDEVEEEEEEVEEEEVTEAPVRRVRRRRSNPPKQEKRRRSSRIALKQNKKGRKY